MVLSRVDLEEIGSVVNKDFARFCHNSGIYSGKKYQTAIPIDLFASQYLGLHVSYIRLSSDGSLCGLTAYVDTEYRFQEMGITRMIPLKQNQVLLDSRFLYAGRGSRLYTRRRFTLAHECAHQILFQLSDDAEKYACKKQYSAHTAYSLHELKTREDWNEWQANVLGAAILMPQERINSFMAYYAGGRKLKNYNGVFSNSDKVLLLLLCKAFDVSQSDAAVRLKGLGYMEVCSRSMYQDPLEILA